jgi:hypothetical protein
VGVGHDVVVLGFQKGVSAWLVNENKKVWERSRNVELGGMK